MDKKLFKAPWKSNCPQRVNILMWIILFGSLNCAEILQKKSPSRCLQPSVCPLCMNVNESLLHLFLLCFFSSVCWNSFFSIFDIAWVFEASFGSLVLQLLEGPPLPYKPLADLVKSIKSSFSGIVV